MDNLCHTLVGAAFGEAGLKRTTRFGSATLMIASNIPDIDVLIFATPVPSVVFRRGWTHGPIADALLPIALTGIMMAVAKRRPAKADDPPFRPWWILLLSYIGVLCHIALDATNPYGLRFLAPFDWRWFYVDALYIIDPWMWLMLGAGVWWARRSKMPAAAHVALVACAVYVSVMVVSVRMAREIVIDAWRASHAGSPMKLMVGPVPGTPLRRDVVIDAGDRYETGTFRWLPARVQLDSESVPKNDRDARVAIAREAPAIAGFLVWSRFPFWTFEPVPGGTRVTVSDLRFAGQTPARFVASTVVSDRRIRR